MAAYVSAHRIKEDHLTQLRDTHEWDTALDRCAAAATALIENELGYSFAATAVGTRAVYGDGTDYLLLPVNAVAGTVTAVTTLAGYTVPSYVEQSGYLVVTDSAGIIAPSRSLYGLTGLYPYGGWLRGVPYTVSATYGYGAVPEDIARLCAEIAVIYWRFRDSGGSEVVGAEGGATINVRAALSPLQKAVLHAHKATSGIGVY